MDTPVPYMQAVGNVPKILQAMQKAAVPEVFNRDFLRDLGFTSSGDRAFIRILKYLGFIDDSNRPTDAYRNYMDTAKSAEVLGSRIRIAFDDLFASNTNAQAKSSTQLKNWFKAKTGVSEAVAEKVASQFRSLASLADFSHETIPDTPQPSPPLDPSPAPDARTIEFPPATPEERQPLSFVYRFEIHLPDTQNIDTYRAIFRALREELPG